MKTNKSPKTLSEAWINLGKVLLKLVVPVTSGIAVSLVAHRIWLGIVVVVVVACNMTSQVIKIIDNTYLPEDTKKKTLNSLRKDFQILLS